MLVVFAPILVVSVAFVHLGLVMEFPGDGSAASRSGQIPIKMRAMRHKEKPSPLPNPELLFMGFINILPSHNRT